MNRKPLKRRSKLELLELLAEQEREIEELKQQLEQRDRFIAQRTLQAQKCGNIAREALAVNEIFQAAQKAADQYVENVKRNVEELLETHGVYLPDPGQAKPNRQLRGASRRSKE